MKIAIINDTHFGVGNGSDIFIDYMRKFFEKEFFPYCEKNKIDTIIHAGDFLDHRKYVNFKALRAVKEFFLNKLIENNMLMHIIPGNHDVYWKQTNDLNSIDLILDKYKENVLIWHNPIDLCVSSDENDYYQTVGLVPWITNDNFDESIDFIKNKCESKIMIGHFEIEGFKMMKNSPIKSHGGMSLSAFDKYDIVLSGHYHTKSKQGNVQYLGTQYELTWSDVDDQKNFHILDTKTSDITPIHNPHKLFIRYVYDDSVIKDLDNIDMTKFAGKYVKIIVSNKSDHFLFDKFLYNLELQNPIDYRIFESFEEFESKKIDDANISIENTETLISSYLDATKCDESINKDILKKKFQTLYTEAQHHGTI